MASRSPSFSSTARAKLLNSAAKDPGADVVIDPRLIEKLDIRLPRLAAHHRQPRAPIAEMDLELVPVGIEEIERGSFAPIVLPDRRAGGAYPRHRVVPSGAGNTEGDVRIFGQWRSPNLF